MYAPLQTLLDTLGHELTRALLAARGGERIYLPQPEHITAEHDIARIVGVEPARALARLWEQEHVDLPLASRQFLSEIRAAILRDREEMTVRELVRKYRPITRRSILRILAEGPVGEAKQRKLF